MGHLGAGVGQVYGSGGYASTMVLFLLASAPAQAPSLAVEGEALGAAVVERVELHPEFQRFWLRYPEGGILPAEVTFARPGHEGLCTAGGATLFPREELLEGPRPADVTGPMGVLCERLPARIPTFERPAIQAPRRASGGAPPPSADYGTLADRTAPPVPRAFDAVGLALAAATLAALAGPARAGWRALAGGERLAVAGVALLGLLVRLVASPRTIFNGEGAAYEKITQAWALDASNPYGEGFGTLYGWPLYALGRAPEALFGLNLAVSALVPPLVWVAARRLAALPGWVRAAPVAAATGAGVAAALWPIAVRLAATEAMHVPVTTLVAASLAAGLGQVGRASAPLAALTALAAGVAAHVRPEAAPFAAVAAGLLLAGRGTGARVALAALVALIAWRAALLPRGQEVLDLRAYADPVWWAVTLRPSLEAPGSRTGAVAFLVGWAPPVLWAAAAVGLAALRARGAALLLGLWATLELPVLPKAFPLADLLRLQLPAHVGWMLLVGLGVGRLAAWRPGAGAVALAAVAGGSALGLGRHPVPVWVHQQEYAVLARVARTLPADAVVVFPDTWSRAARFARVMRVVSGARWIGASAAEPPPSHAWLGVGCATAEGRAGCDALRERCTLVPLAVERLAPVADVDLPLPPEGVEVGLYRVGTCRPPEPR